ncbi:MAG: hypothetical protein IBX36_02920 [Dehalococcoidia bacterium]|nr:hypothetical protein [Dehalococcoidia bacterium]
MIRSLYPTDLVSLLFFTRRALPNEAMARDRLGKRSLLFPQAFLEHWLPLRCRRRTWVSLERGRVLGIVSAMSCSGSTVWQIDYLQVNDEECCLALLDRVSTAATKRGAKKLFLRLPSTSPLIDGARRAGFSCYAKNYLYRYEGEGVCKAAEVPEPYLFRPRSRGDEYGLFDLYNAAVPIPVRTAEGMTLREWQETRGWGSGLEEHREFVLQRQDSLVGWLRVHAARGTGCFEIMFHQLDEDSLEWLVNYALMCLDGKSPICCVASAFQGQLLGLLERLDFEQVAEYSTLVKELALRVSEPFFAPARA